jgi:uncharacterized membrane protein (DUF106 family)
MIVFNQIVTFIFDLIFAPFSGLSPVWGLIFISVATGLFMLLIFKRVSNQEGIRAVKNHIQAYLLELRLYQHDAGLSVQAFRNVMKSNMKYLGYALKPMLFLFIPVLLIMIQIAVRYEYRSLSVGEQAVLDVCLSEGVQGSEFRLEAPENIRIETPPLFIPDEDRIYWRIRAVSKGEGELVFRYGQKALNKQIFVDSHRKKISPEKVKASSLKSFLYPAEPPLSGKDFLREIHLHYPHQSLTILGIRIHWLVLFFIFSMITGFMFKNVFGVEI